MVGILLVLTACAGASCRARHAIGQRQPQHHTPSASDQHSPTVFLVMYDAEVGKGPLLEAIQNYGCEIIYDYHIINGMALKKPDEVSLEQTMQHFKTVKGVLSVDYDHIYRLTDPVQPKLELK